MKYRRSSDIFKVITDLFVPKAKQVDALIHEVLLKQKQLTGSARIIHKGQLLNHPSYPKDPIGNAHPSLKPKFDDCIVQVKQLQKLKQQVTEYLIHKQHEYPKQPLWKFMPSSIHSWFDIDFRGKVADDIPQWLDQLCAELCLLRMIYAND